MEENNTIIKEQIIRVLGGIADAEDERSLQDWIDSSEENKKYYLDVYNIWMVTRFHAEKRDIEDSYQRFSERISTQYDDQPHFSKRKRWYWAAGISAASLLLLLFVRSFLFPALFDREIVYSKVFSTQDAKKKITLADSSVVWLNAYSSISFPEDFNRHSRQVKIEGEAYFDVTHDAGKPFVVSLNENTITVLGTSFTVSNRTGSTSGEVVLQEGSIRLNLGHEDKSILLNPNEKATYSNTDGSFSVEKVDANLYCVWAKDKLEFRKEKLSSVFERFEKWYGIEVDYPREKYDSVQVSFTIVDESIEQALKVMSLVVPVHYTIDKNNIIIK